MFRRCFPENEIDDILRHCHTEACGGHGGMQKTVSKILQCGFYWPSMGKTVKEFVTHCDRCQRTGNISKRNEMPQ